MSTAISSSCLTKLSGFFYNQQNKTQKQGKKKKKCFVQSGADGSSLSHPSLSSFLFLNLCQPNPFHNPTRISIPPQSTKPSTPTAMTGSVLSISSTGSKPNPISNTQLIRTIVCSTFYVSSSNSSFLGT